MTGDADAATAGTGRVLLVDDDPAVRRDYGRLLRALGCTVATAVDGVDAVAQLGAGAFDLVVSDIGMPGLSGLDFLRAVRERDLDVPVVLITGAPDLEGAVAAVEYGAFRYLTKPVPMATLGQVVRQAIHLHALAPAKPHTGAACNGCGVCCAWQPCPLGVLAIGASSSDHFKSSMDTLFISFIGDVLARALLRAAELVEEGLE